MTVTTLTDMHAWLATLGALSHGLPRDNILIVATRFKLVSLLICRECKHATAIVGLR